MSWNPTPGQDPNPNNPNQYGGYQPQPGPSDPYSGQPQSGGYQQPQSGYTPPQQPPPGGGYQQPGTGYGQQGQQYGYQQPQYGSPAPGAGGPGNYGPSTLGMEANLAAFLSYLFSPVSALIIFLMEKQNRFIRFHAMQALLFTAVLIALEVIFAVIGRIPILNIVLLCVSPLTFLGYAVVWIILMVNAFQGKYFKLPIIGDYAERYAAPGAAGTGGGMPGGMR